MAFRERTATHRILHVGGEVKEPKGMSDGGTRDANLRGDLLLREVELILELMVRDGAVDGIEVLALDVLHERKLELRAVIVLPAPDDHRHCREPREFRGAESTFTGDELVRTIDPHCDDERLQDAVRTNGRRER